MTNPTALRAAILAAQVNRLLHKGLTADKAAQTFACRPQGPTVALYYREAWLMSFNPDYQTADSLHTHCMQMIRACVRYEFAMLGDEMAAKRERE